MRKLIFLCGTMMFCAAGALAQIEGDVSDPNGKGIANASLAAIDSGGKVVASVKSDDRGFYAFHGLSRGKYRIEAKAAGFRTAFFESVEVNEDSVGEKGGDKYYGVRLDIVLKPDQESTKTLIFSILIDSARHIAKGFKVSTLIRRSSFLLRQHQNNMAFG